jgi:hypothetical protein
MCGKFGRWAVTQCGEEESSDAANWHELKTTFLTHAAGNPRMHPKLKMATPATVSTKQGLNPAPPSITPCTTAIDWEKIRKRIQRPAAEVSVEHGIIIAKTSELGENGQETAAWKCARHVRRSQG